MIFGRTSFNDFLNAEEGIATNILTDRLQRLELSGIIVKHRDPGDARKFIYRLTEKGMDLAPMIVEMVLWSVRYENAVAPPEAVKGMKFGRDAFIESIKKKWLDTSLP